MDQFLRDKNRDTILFVNNISDRSEANFRHAVKELSKILKRRLKVLVVIEKRDKVARKWEAPEGYERIVVNTESVTSLETALKPYLEKLLLIVCRSEKNIPYFRNIIPHVPYLEAPTETSLEWSNDKINMRRRLRSYDKSISPAYTIVEDSSKESIAKIKSKVGFPLVVKPAGLAASVLVTVAYHEEELIKILKRTITKAQAVYKRRGRLTQPRILVEEFMEGQMYVTDIYVNSRGTMYTTPLVSVKTGYSAGQEDFYGYKQATPVALKPHKHAPAFTVAKQAIEALGLRSLTAHVELMKTEDGWKVVEVNPRIGGFRDFLYMSVYNIDHSLNDLLIRLPMRPIIPRKANGYAMVMKMYPKSQGEIASILGVKRIKELSSVVHVSQNLKRGDQAFFARNGGVSVIDVFLFNKKRSDLLADVHRVEQTLDIRVRDKKTKAVEKTLSPALVK